MASQKGQHFDTLTTHDHWPGPFPKVGSIKNQSHWTLLSGEVGRGAGSWPGSQHDCLTTGPFHRLLASRKHRLTPISHLKGPRLPLINLLGLGPCTENSRRTERDRSPVCCPPHTLTFETVTQRCPQAAGSLHPLEMNPNFLSCSSPSYSPCLNGSPPASSGTISFICYSRQFSLETSRKLLGRPFTTVKHRRQLTAEPPAAQSHGHRTQRALSLFRLCGFASLDLSPHMELCPLGSSVWFPSLTLVESFEGAHIGQLTSGFCSFRC